MRPCPCRCRAGTVVLEAGTCLWAVSLERAHGGLSPFPHCGASLGNHSNCWQGPGSGQAGGAGRCQPPPSSLGFADLGS